MSAPPNVTELLEIWSQGDRAALERLLPEMYVEMRRLAARCLGSRGVTLQPTALVNEAYLRLVEQSAIVCEDRRHFLAIAAQAMRWILIDHARKRDAAKRGGNELRVTFSEADLPGTEPDLDLLELDAALNELAQLDARQARIVELRYFGGLSIPEAAAMLDISPATVKREWALARAWLYRRLAG